MCTSLPYFLRGCQCWKKKTSNILAARTRTIIPTLSSASFSHVNIYALAWIRSRGTNCAFHPTTNFTSDKINLLAPPNIFFFFLPQWPRRTSDFVSCGRGTLAGTFHRGAPSPVPRPRSLLFPVLFRVSLAFRSFHCDQPPLFHIYVEN